MEELWKLERDFWLLGAEHFTRALDPNCLMALPSPAGIMAYRSIIESLSGAPRWSNVSMSGKTSTSPADGLAILAYEVTARRSDVAPYTAICLSTYRHDGARWLMTSHQQTPGS